MQGTNPYSWKQEMFSVGRTQGEKDDTDNTKFRMVTLDGFIDVGLFFAAMALIRALTSTQQRILVMGGLAFIFLSISSIIAMATKNVVRSFKSRESKKLKNMIFKVGVGLCSLTISIGTNLLGISLANFFD